ncbi:MAG: hypothetical protein ACT4P7_18630 [Gemmatimonadaceae bacterium]
MRRRVLAIAGLLATVSVSPLDAQQRIGGLTEIRGLRGCVPAPRAARAPDNAVRVNRGPAGYVAIERGADMRVRDSIEVRRMVDAKVFSPGTDGFGQGDIVFSPELGTCTTYAAEFQQRGRRLGGANPGRYVVTSRVERRGGRDTTRLIISVESGGLVADWKGGLFSLVALGREIQLTGTRVAVVVDSGATEAFVVVAEGTVQLLGAAGATRTINAGQVARFDASGPGIAVSPMAEDLATNLGYHLERVFDVPTDGGGFSLGKALGTAIVVGGVGYGGYYAYDRWIKRPPAAKRFRNGTIVVRIPI